MTTFVDAHPVARKRHRCGVCRWWIEPGETYWRQSALDGATAWTNKTCEHCQHVVAAYVRDVAEHEWDEDALLEWLFEYSPGVFAGMRAGWRFPDGARMAPPFEPRCVDCGGPHPQMWAVWCIPCDDARLARQRDAGGVR